MRRHWGWLGVAAIAGGVIAAFPQTAIVPLLLAGGALFFLSSSRGKPATTLTPKQPDSLLLVWAVRLFLPLAAAGSLTEGLSALMLLGLAIVTFSQSASESDHQLHARIPLVPTLLVAVGAMAWLIGWQVTETLTISRAALLAVLGSSALLILGALCTRPSPVAIDVLTRALVDSLAIYLVANVALYGFGVHSPADDVRLRVPQSTIEALGDRVTFPLTVAITMPPAIASAYLTAILTGGRGYWRAPIWYGGSAIAACAVLILANGRLAVAAMVMLTLALWVAPRLVNRTLPALATSALMLPFWWPVLSPFLVPVVSTLGEVVQYLDRGAPTQFETLQNRTLLWTALMERVPTIPAANLLLGFGARGQAPSGLAEDFAPYFRSLVDPLQGSAHNSLFQEWIDTGLMGAGVLLAAVLRLGSAISSQCNEASPSRRVLASTYLTLAIVGAMESNMSVGTPGELFWLLLALFFVVEGARRRQSPIGSWRTRVSRHAFTTVASARGR